jgi:phage-related protein
MTYPTHPDIQFTQDSGGSEVNYMTKEMQFAGYRQRTVVGTNNVQSVWNLSCTDMSLADSKVLADFLDERAGLPFYWTPTRQTTPLLFTTDKRSTSSLRATHETATVTYTRWFGADDS